MISSKLKNKLLVERWFYSKYGRKFSRYHSRSIKFYLSSKSYEVSYEMPCNVCFVARAPCARTWISRSRSAEMSRRTPISSTPPSSEWQLLLSLQPSTTISNVICVCTFHRRIVPNSLDQSFGAGCIFVLERNFMFVDFKIWSTVNKSYNVIEEKKWLIPQKSRTKNICGKCRVCLP